MGKIRIGIIGAAGGQGGSWTKRVSQWSRDGSFNIELAALCDKNAAVKRRAEEFGNVPYFLDYEEMYKKTNLDLVIIATPHYLHAPMAIEAAENEINILVEKPMAITLKQADAMRKAVFSNDVKLAVGFQHRFTPSFVALKKIFEAGELGQIFQWNAFIRDWRTDMYYETSTRVKDPLTGKEHGWRGYWATEGAGALANQLIHFIDIYQWLAPAPVKSIMANSSIAHHNFTETDDNTNAIVEFTDGSQGNLQLGVAYEYGGDSEFGAYGIDGAVVLRKNMFDENGKRVSFLDYRKNKKKPLEEYIPDIKQGDKEMFGALIKAIEEDDRSFISVDVEEGRKSVEIMRGILLSVIFEKKVTFPLHDAEIWPSLGRTYKDPMFYY